MKKFMETLKDKLAPSFEKLAANPYVVGIKDGMMSTVPFTIFGSVFIILTQFPNDAWKAMVAPYSAMLNVPYNMTMGIIATYVAFSIGYSLAKALKQDPLMGGLVSFVGFMILQVDESYQLSTAYFGSKGIFTALLTAIFCVKLLQIFKKNNWVIRFPEGVPEIVSNSFSALIPGSVALTILFVLRCVLGLEIPLLVTKLFSPLVFALNSYPGILVYVFFCQLLWSVGIHGQSVLNAVGTPIFTSFITANTEAFIAGEPIPYITATGFVQYFVNIGGTGATLALVLLMIRSKEKSLSTLGKLCLPAGCFGVNEPVTFGLPIVMNPVMMLPFILIPCILTTGTYILMALNIIGRPVVQVPWIMPPVIGAYLTTNGNIPAALWCFAEIILTGIMYYPFFKTLEKELMTKETAKPLPAENAE